MILFTIYDLFTKILYDGDGKKNPEIYKNRKKKIPRLVALASSRLQSGGRLISGVRKHPKQGGSTLGGRRLLI